ncbi:MAG: glycosyltransferase [Lachnospiraceae bacterium]|nr:glycosyltransferase [Lachnospiraceae bacterium]
MISVCIITKNEKELLEKCLKAIEPYGFEIVVVDTGSTDGTKEMVGKYTDKIFDFRWCNDFSAARNFSISKATGEVILVLDSDEIVTKLDLEKLQFLTKNYPRYAGRIIRINEYETAGNFVRNKEKITRIFSKKNYYYTGTIHEQVTPIGGDISAEVEVYDAPVEVFHLGYAGTEEQRKAKAMRNAGLLLKEYEHNNRDPYIIYQLGKSYYMFGDYHKAMEYIEKAFEIDINPKLHYVIDMMITYGYCMLNTGRAADGLMLESVYEEFSYVADFLFVMGLIYMNNLMFDKAVEQFEKAAKISDEYAYTEGTNSFLAYYNAGVIMQCLGRKDEAIAYYKKCGDYDKAVKQLKELKNE